MTLGEALARRDSGALTGLRLALALAVVVSHAWPLALGHGVAEPLADLTGRSLGGWAVLSFFFLSGILISGSAERQAPGTFWAARARRIVPGLAVALVVTAVLALLSGARAGVGDLAEYVVRGVTLVSIEHRIAGAFAANPLAEVVNGPIWSLFHEVAAYGLCFLAVRLGVTRTLLGPAVVLVMAIVAMQVPGLPARAETFAPLFAAFAAGMLAWRMRDGLPLDARLFLPALVLAVAGGPALEAALFAGLLIAGFGITAVPMRHDYSYGVYLYGWPVAQMIVHLVPGVGAVELAVVSMLASLPLAAASWHLVERPVLRGPLFPGPFRMRKVIRP